MATSRKRALVIGAGGMLGREVVQVLRSRGQDVIESVWPDPQNSPHSLDITDAAAVNLLIEQLKPTVIYNCSAFTDVDGSEDQEELATAVNATGVANLARAACRTGSLLAHVSTDYVFDGRGERPYRPDDATAPQTAYGRSKLTGEQAVQSSNVPAVIVRTSWLFGHGGKNFIDTILALAQQRDNLKVVNDQVGSPTYAPDLARCLADLADASATGVFHFCNRGQCSWFDFARKAVELAHLDCSLSPCSTSDFPRPAQRPTYSVLDCSKTFDKLGWSARTWQDALADYLSTR